jgi:hypothetical protein
MNQWITVRGEESPARRCGFAYPEFSSQERFCSEASETRRSLLTRAVLHQESIVEDGDVDERQHG